MQQFTETHNFNMSKKQKESLYKLKGYNINVAQFIRDAIKEKIQRDWPMIKEYNKTKCPF